MNIVRELKIKCAEVGITLTELCREANVNRSVLAKWQKNEPKTIVTIKVLESKLEEIKAKQ